MSPRPKSRRPRRAKRAAPWPTLPKDAELVLKETWEVDGTGDRDVPVPCLAILANRQGYRYLAKFFEWMAGQDDLMPDNHVHFNSFGDEVFNTKLSDQVTFRLVKFAPATRADVLEYNGAQPEKALRTDAVARYRRRIQQIGRNKADGVISATLCMSEPAL